MTKRQWEKGRALTVEEAFTAIHLRHPVYFNHKWTHNGWARGWPINLLIASAQAGRIFEAKKIQEEVT